MPCVKIITIGSVAPERGSIGCAKRMRAENVLRAGERHIRKARTFCDVAPGEAFWYENANGLAEIAANRGRAADLLGLRPGSPVEPVRQGEPR